MRGGKFSRQNPSQTDVEKADDDQEYDPFVSVVFGLNRSSVVKRCRMNLPARRDLTGRTRVEPNERVGATGPAVG